MTPIPITSSILHPPLCIKQETWKLFVKACNDGLLHVYGTFFISHLTPALFLQQRGNTCHSSVPTYWWSHRHNRYIPSNPSPDTRVILTTAWKYVSFFCPDILVKSKTIDIYLATPHLTRGLFLQQHGNTCHSSVQTYWWSHFRSEGSNSSGR